MFKWIISLFRGKDKDTVTIEMEGAHNALVQSVSVQIQPDASTVILQSSQKHINTLKIYVNYFDNRTLTDILNQTEVIHDVFSNNKDLNFNKLEQYHYYYTVHLEELLEKLKKSKDENLSIVNTQIKSLENKIANGKKKSNQILQGDIKKLDNSKAQYAQTMSLQLASIYNCMVDNFNDFRFKRRNAFITYTNKNGIDLAWSLDSDLFLSLIAYDSNGQYTWDDFKIERKLMGRLQKYLFHIEFIGMCYSSDSSFEIFKFSETDDYFMYVHELGIFKFLDYKKIQEFLTTNNTKFGNLNKEIDQLEEKKIEVKSKLNDFRSIDFKTEEILQQYLKKIEDVELITKISDVDLQRMNLKSILELEQINI